MITLSRIIVLIIIIGTFIYTISYGRWTWKKKNKLGAIMIFILAIAVILLPVYSLFFRS